MAENLDLNIKVNTSGAEGSIGSLKKQLREAQNDVLSLSEKFGATSVEAVNAAKKAAELRDRIGDAKALTDAFNPDAKFKALTASLAGVAGGFGAVQGAMALFGNESENVQKTLLKVQSAMALSQGLQAVGESVDSFKQLGAVIRTQVVTAFSTLRGAIIATGIGLLAVALGLVVANFESIKKVITNLFPGLGKLTDFVGGLVTKLTDFVGITSAASRALEVLQKSTKLRNEDIERQIKLLSAQGGKEKEIFTLQKESAQNEINLLKKKVDEKGKLYGADADNYKNLQNQLKVIDATEANRIKKLGEDTAKEKKTKDVKNEEDRLKEQERNDASIKANQDFELQIQQDANAREEEAARKKEDARIKEEERNTASMKSNVDFEVQLANDLLALEEETLQRKKEFKEIELEADRQLQEAKYENAQNALYLLEGLAGRNEQLANIIFAVSKALEIGKIISTTASAIVGVKAGVAAVPAILPPGIPNPAFAVAAGIGAGKIAALKIGAGISIATIAAGTIARFKSGGSGDTGGGGGAIGGAAPMIPQAPQAQVTQLNQQSINDIGNQAVRAYVIESDVTSNQQRIAAIRQRARFS
jgi:hypothetical protein